MPALRADISLLGLAVVGVLSELACVLTGHPTPGLFQEVTLAGLAGAAGVALPASPPAPAPAPPAPVAAPVPPAAPAAAPVSVVYQQAPPVQGQPQ